MVLVRSALVETSSSQVEAGILWSPLRSASEWFTKRLVVATTYGVQRVQMSSHNVNAGNAARSANEKPAARVAAGSLIAEIYFGAAISSMGMREPWRRLLHRPDRPCRSVAVDVPECGVESARDITDEAPALLVVMSRKRLPGWV